MQDNKRKSARIMVCFLRQTGYSMPRIAKAIGVSVATVFRLEHGGSELRDPAAYGRLVWVYERRAHELDSIVAEARR